MAQSSSHNSNQKFHVGFITQKTDAADGYHAIIEEEYKNTTSTQNDPTSMKLHLCNGSTYYQGKINVSDEKAKESVHTLAPLSPTNRLKAIRNSVNTENNDKAIIDESQQEYRVSTDWGLEFGEYSINVDVATVPLSLERNSAEFLHLAMRQIAQTREKTKMTRVKQKIVQEEIQNLQKAYDVLQEYASKRSQRIESFVNVLNEYKTELQTTNT